MDQEAIIFIYAVAFAVGIWITRLIFSIPQMLKYQKAHLKLLALIAEKQGADQELIKEIVVEANNELRNDPHFKSGDEEVKPKPDEPYSGWIGNNPS